MGEAKRRPLRFHFDRRLKLEFHGARVSSDAGRLRVDPVARHVIGRKAKDHPAASTSQMGRFETEILATEENLAALTDLNEEWVVRACTRTPMDRLVLDMDSSVSPTYGEQEGSAYNGHFGQTCYHPLFCFNQYGDLERARLRNGNVPSAHDWRSVLEPVVARYRDRSLPRYFRADAAFALPELYDYDYLEEEDFSYAIRIPANEVLRRKIAPLLTRPVGRPAKQPKVLFASFRYQAKTWTRPRRVVAKVEWHLGELFPRVGFLVTNLRWPSRRAVHFYNQRGTAEQWIREGKIALHWTRLSCHAFLDNAVRLQLFALAYNLGNFLRRLVLPERVRHWCLTTLRDKLIKIGAKVVSHGRYVIFQLAEVAVPQALFRQILQRIRRLEPIPDTG